MKCWICGKDNADVTRNFTVEFKVYGNAISRRAAKKEHQRCYCQKCYDEHIRQLKEENELYIKLRRKRLYESALIKLEKQGLDFSEYEEAIKAVGT